MEDPPIREILILLLLVLLNGFFSMSEMSIVSSRKARLRAKAEAGRKSYRRALHAAENPSRYLSTIQIGITLIGTLAGAFGGATIAHPLASALSAWQPLVPYAQGIAVAIVVLSITFLSIVLGELVPKQIALSAPEAVAATVVPVLEIIARIFRPVVSFLSRATVLILKLIRIPEHPDHAVSEEEIRIVLMEGEKSGVVEEQERSMVEGVFYLGDRPVETFMTHRSDVTWLDVNAGSDQARAAALSARGQAHFPVATGGLDEVVGVVSAQEILAALIEKKWNGLRTLFKKPVFVPGTMSALKAFEAFKRGGTELLLVMDEYGGLAGTLSIRNLVEEIVGELSTRDTDNEEIVKREDGSYLVGGFVNVDEFAELFSIARLIPEHREYHTLAGFVLEIAGAIPKTGEVFDWEGFKFEIVDMDGNRIDKVIVKPPVAAVSEETPSI